MKRTDSIADNIPNALKQSQYYMKRCFAMYMEKGRRILKIQELRDELEKVIDDKSERDQVLEGYLGAMFSSVQVNTLIFSLLSHSFVY